MCTEMLSRFGGGIMAKVGTDSQEFAMDYRENAIQSRANDVKPFVAAVLVCCRSTASAHCPKASPVFAIFNDWEA